MGWPRWLDELRFRGRLRKQRWGRVAAGGDDLREAGQFSLTVLDDGSVRGRGAMAVDLDAHLGNVEEGLLQVPEALAGLKGRRVLQVSGTFCHALLLLEGGQVMSFGAGWHGMLGHGDDQDQHTPKLIEASRGKQVVQVSAGTMHSLLLLEGGGVMSFGYGSHGAFATWPSAA